jgi:hypothetical protein
MLAKKFFFPLLCFYPGVRFLSPCVLHYTIGKNMKRKAPLPGVEETRRHHTRGSLISCEGNELYHPRVKNIIMLQQFLFFRSPPLVLFCFFFLRCNLNHI